jgi:hypothetical protein
MPQRCNYCTFAFIAVFFCLPRRRTLVEQSLFPLIMFTDCVRSYSSIATRFDSCNTVPLCFLVLLWPLGLCLSLAVAHEGGKWTTSTASRNDETSCRVRVSASPVHVHRQSRDYRITADSSEGGPAKSC